MNERIPPIKDHGAIWTLVLTSTLLQAQSPQETANQIHRQSQQPGECVVIGLSAASGRSFGFAGAVGLNGAAPDQDTLFEIGSITKVFTALLLAETFREGKAGFGDPAGRYLPPEAIGPQSPLLDVITLESLATHTSGLPRLPANLSDGADPANPYAHYDASRLHAYLKTLRKEDLKTLGQNSYSNLGAGLLGHVLERIWRQPLPQLMQERIFVPLGMKNTLLPGDRAALPAEVTQKLATGHVGGSPVPYWDLASLAGAGAALSSARDLLTFGEAHWNEAAPPGLRASLTEAVRLRSGSQALGWLRVGTEVSHAGGTGGFRSHLTVDLEKKTVRAELRNSAGESFTKESAGDFSSIGGFWSGVLEIPSLRLRLVHYLDESGRAVAFSIDQGCSWYHASKTSFENGKLDLSFPSVGGHYSGALENGKFVGSWRQTGELPLVFTRDQGIPESLREPMSRKIAGDLAPLRGYWSGKLGDAEGLFIYLQISNAGGLWLCDLFSPDQTPSSIPIDSIALRNGQLTAEWSALGCSYRARLDPEAKLLRGAWKQSGIEQPLELKWSAGTPKK